VGGPLVQDKFGARLSVWYRKDGGWIDRIDPVTLATVDKKANHDETVLVRLAGLWAPSEHWSVTPSIYYQDRSRNDISTYWPLYSDPGAHRFVSADPLAALIARQVLPAVAEDRGRHRRGPADFQHLLLPPAESDRLRRNAVQPRFLPGVRVLPAHATD